MLLGPRGCPEKIAAILSGILVENHDAVRFWLRIWHPTPSLSKTTSMKLLYCKVNSKKTPHGCLKMIGWYSLSCLLIAVATLITQKPSSVIVEEGENVTLVCQATGVPMPTVTWRKALDTVPKEKTTLIDGNMNIVSVTKTDGGTYACSAKNLLGEDSAVALVAVIDRLAFTLTPSTKFVVPQLGNVMLNCQAGIHRNFLEEKKPKSSSESRYLPKQNFISNSGDHKWCRYLHMCS